MYWSLYSYYQLLCSFCKTYQTCFHATVSNLSCLFNLSVVFWGQGAAPETRILHGCRYTSGYHSPFQVIKVWLPWSSKNIFWYVPRQGKLILCNCPLWFILNHNAKIKVSYAAVNPNWLIWNYPSRIISENHYSVFKKMCNSFKVLVHYLHLLLNWWWWWWWLLLLLLLFDEIMYLILTNCNNEKDLSTEISHV